jgi:ADP-ribose pyrophosphatase
MRRSKIHLFAAMDLSAGAARREADEFIETETLPLRRALAMVESGEIRDAKTALALLVAARRFGSLTRRR